MIIMRYATKHSSLPPASGGGRRIARVIPLIAAASLVLFAASTSAFAQAGTTLVPPPRPPGWSDWQRMMEGLRKAKPMPDPKQGVRPNVLTQSGGMRRFDSLTGQSFKVPSARVAAAPSATHRQDGHRGAAPISANGGQAFDLASPQAVSEAISPANG